MVSRTEKARTRWFESGEALLNERANVDDLLTVERLCERDGRSRQAFNQQFGTLDRYVSGLLDYLLHIDRFPWPAELPELIGALAKTDQLLEATRALLEMDFDAFAQDPAAGMMLSLMGGKPTGNVASGLRRIYHTCDDELAPLLDAVLTAWNREPTPPFKTTHLAVLFNALLDGMTLRSRFDSRAERWIYVEGFLCLLPMVTRGRGEDVTIGDRVEVLNTYQRKETL